MFECKGQEVEMEQQEIQEERRARNFVWAAAGQYGLEPLFLAYTPDGTADMYLNIIIGLSYKWYDASMLEDFFHMLGGKQEEFYQGIFWIALEQALYEKEKTYRPVLKELRREYALENRKRYRSYKEYERIDQLRNAHCAWILGLDTGLSGKEEELMETLEKTFTGDMTTEAVIGQMRKVLWDYFSYEPKPVRKERGTYFLQKLLPAFHSIGKMHATYVKTRRYDDPAWEETGHGGGTQKARHYLLQFSRQGNEEKDRAYIEGCFGENIYTPNEQDMLEREICTGNHKNSHIYITRGYGDSRILQAGEESTKQEFSEKTANTNEAENEDLLRNRTGKNITHKKISTAESREIREFRKESRLQAEKNRQYYEKNRIVYENCIRRMTEKFRLELDHRLDEVPVQSRQGTIRASQVWRALYLEDPRIFEKKEEIPDIGFSVDILIDASSSRKNSQEQIAAQAYVLAKSLDLCGIPLQVYSYCSIRGYTVLRLFQSYGESDRAKEVFAYVAAGNNRDGLALRGAGHLMEQSRKEKKLLLMLTDGSPQDDQIAAEGAFYKNREYTDQIAVEDATEQVQQLKRRGIQVVGIFMGSERGLQTVRQIFGRDFVRIEDIRQFSEVVGKILQEKIRQM